MLHKSASIVPTCLRQEDINGTHVCHARNGMFQCLTLRPSWHTTTSNIEAHDILLHCDENEPTHTLTAMADACVLYQIQPLKRSET